MPMKKTAKHRSQGKSEARSDAAAVPGKIRLIGGRWRGTRLPVAHSPGLRPTSDRVRETLFNWLAPTLPGARVLDLFAGSGALGLEALSRGAAAAVLVERDRALAASLRDVAARLAGGDAASIVQADAVQWLSAQPPAQFDVAFVDPPFSAGLWDRVLPPLLPLLRADAWLYVEMPASAAVGALDKAQDWHLDRQGTTREVRYCLYQRARVAADTLPADSQPSRIVGAMPARTGRDPE